MKAKKKLQKVAYVSKHTECSVHAQNSKIETNTKGNLFYILYENPFSCLSYSR